jgi:hypothetical protein
MSGIRIPDEPVFRVLWRRWRMCRKGDLQELETEVLRQIPADVMHALQRGDRQEPLVKHLVQSSITRFVTDIDKRTLEALTEKIMAGTAAVKAATEARRAVHELSRVEQKLGQEAELHNLRHETARLAEHCKQEELSQIMARLQRAAASQEAQRAWLERELEGTGSPGPKVTNKWEALLQAFRGDVTGVADFQTQTDACLADYGERHRDAVHEEDPQRPEKLARIDGFVEELRSLRDRMMRDAWGLGGGTPQR